VPSPRLQSCLDGTWCAVLSAIGKNSGDELARLLGERQAATIGPVDALFLAQQLCDDGILLYSNGHRFWNDPGVMQGIWDLRDPFKATGRMLVAAGSTRRGRCRRNWVRTF